MSDSPAEGDIADAVARDPFLTDLLDRVSAHPPDQHRLFRARWRSDGSRCVLKVGLGELEANWMPEVSRRCTDVVPRVRAHGASLVGRDLGWLVMDDLPHLARSNDPAIARDVMRATARFHQEALRINLPTYPIDAAFARRYAEQAITHGCPGPASRVLDRIDAHDRWLRAQGDYVVGHGDAHFWNAISADPDGPWRLIDPIPRTAHWAWDAAYAQITSGLPGTPDLIALLADQRRRLGLTLPGIERLDTLRAILLGWSSIMWWAILPQRRHERWWAEEIRRHVRRLAELGAG